jgi:hypothetical protein
MNTQPPKSCYYLIITNRINQLGFKGLGYNVRISHFTTQITIYSESFLMFSRVSVKIQLM